MKQILISRINPCCLLSYADMVFWIDNLSGISDATRNLIKDNLMMNGQLKTEGWQILSGAVQFEQGSPITAQNINDWATYQTTLTCNQLKTVIEYTKLDGNFIPVETPPLNLVTLDIKTMPLEKKPNAYQKHIYKNTDTLVISKIPEFHIGNWELIKDSNPYLVIERWKPSNNKTKMGWRRAPNMKVGDNYWDGWTRTSVPITHFDMHRPNEIPLTSAKQFIDIYAENYIQNSRGNKKIPIFVGSQNKSNKIEESPGSLKKRQRIPLRFRIGIRAKGKEYLSPPLLETTIYANAIDGLPGKANVIRIGFGKI